MKKANMKRENKAYSFKEQIIELELKEVSWWKLESDDRDNRYLICFVAWLVAYVYTVGKDSLNFFSLITVFVSISAVFW